MDFKQPSFDEIVKIFKEIKECDFLIKGGFKFVYKVKINNKFEAFKLAYVPFSKKENENIKDSENYKRIMRELDILKKCQHRNIVKLGSVNYKHVLIDSRNYIAYSEEFIDGKSLKNLIDEKFKPDENELKLLFKTILSVIKYIWEDFHYLHRDIKPLNIMRINDKKRKFILLDFGLAYALTETSITTNSAAIPGTIEYLAPEMLDPKFRQSIDYRSDLYNLALTIYEFAVGINPIARKRDAQYNTLMNVKNKIPDSLKTHRSDLSDDFCELINQLLKKQPSLRPSDFENLFKRLEDK